MAKNDWKIGVLFSKTGETSAVESTMANATLLAIEEINARGGILGRAIAPTFHDPSSSPPKYKELVKALLDDHIRIVFAGFTSTSRKAILPEIEAHRGLLFYPTYYEGFEFSQRCIYTGAAPNQFALQLADYLLRNQGKTFILVGSNYVFPYEINRIISDFVIHQKGRILDEIYVPLTADAADVRKVIKQAQKLKPDAIISTLLGRGAVMLYEFYAEAGLDPDQMPIASIGTSEAEFILMKPGVAKGHLSAVPFFQSLDTPEARCFVAAYKARFGKDAHVTASAEAAYFQVHLYAKALELAQNDDPDELLRVIDGLEIDAPQGRVRVSAENHHTALWPRVGKVNDRNEIDIVWQASDRAEPDPYFLFSSDDEWLRQSRAAGTF